MERRLINAFVQRSWQRLTLLTLAVAALLSVGTVAGALAAQPVVPAGELPGLNQASTPDVTPTGDASTPAASSAPSVSGDTADTGQSEINADEPTAAITADGLAYWPGGDAVWRVRQVTVPSGTDAQSVKPTYYGFFIQRGGKTIVRNDVTNRRAQLEAGEAYFFSADDGYTFQQVGDGQSVAWLIELTPPNTAIDDALGGDAVYQTDPISFDEATFDAELSRNVLVGGASGTVYAGNGPTLLIGSTGTTQADPGDGTSLDLAPGDGLTVMDSATTNNSGTDPVVYMTVALRDEIIDQAASTPGASAGTPSATGANGGIGAAAATGGTPEAGAGAVPTVAGDDGTDTDGDGLTDAQEAQLGSDPNAIDTDGDGVDDYTEVVTYGTNPTAADTDGDSLPDGDEIYTYGTDPTSADTDGDGANDSDEINAGTDPFDASSKP